MLSITALAPTLQRLLTPVADRAAPTSRLMRRRGGTVTGATFVQPCGFGWVSHPDASLSQLAQTAATCGLDSTPQGVDERFTPAAATCLKTVLDAARRELPAADPVALPLLRRFKALYKRW